MKKTLLTIAAIFTAATAANAQYKVGDCISINDVPAIVVSVDASGEHGLALQLDRVLEQFEIEQNQAVSLENREEWKSLSKAERKALRAEEAEKARVEREERINHMMAIIDRVGHDGGTSTSRNGKVNMEAVEAYCAEKGLDIEKAFPEYAWVKSLGEGWYLPGDAELEVAYKFICGGFGKDIRHSRDYIKAKNDAIQAQAGFEKNVLPNYPVKSSTWVKHTLEEKEDPVYRITPHLAMPYGIQGMKADANVYWYILVVEPIKFMGIKTPPYQSYNSATVFGVYNF